MSPYHISGPDNSLESRQRGVVYFLQIGREGTANEIPLLLAEEKINGRGISPHFFLEKNWGFLILRVGLAGSLSRAIPGQGRGRVKRHWVEILKPLGKGEGRTT
jgi:hypothetical protein